MGLSVEKFLLMLQMLFLILLETNGLIRMVLIFFGGPQ